MLYDLERVLNTIKSTMHHHKNNAYFPYFFIVGAGISVPEIPTASKIVDICKETVQAIDPELFIKYDEKLRELANDNMKYYSAWIECAYPNRIDRSNLFKGLCSKAKISSANLMLAQILHSNEFANTVFTPNFDDSIKKALELMGTKNFFCAENSMDNLVISNQTKDIQIVHVHGTFAFYECANLEKEIDNVASQSSAISSAQLLSSFLSNQAPIIVGYSGWENDVIMRCLKERLTYPTPLQYIWICHSKQSYQNLPAWIKENDNVIFVVPEAIKDTCSEPYNKLSWDSSSINDSIDATMFFKRIIASFKLTPPLIFTDPYLYYSKKIHAILPENEDVLHLRHWAQRLKTIENNDIFENLVQRLESAYIAKDYNEANAVLLEMGTLSLNEANIDFVCTSLIREFIRDEDIVSSLDIRLKFRLAALDIIENNLSQQINVSSLISTLRDILFVSFRYSDKEKVITLFDRVIELSHKDPRLLVVELAALGTKSDFVNKELKERLLREILARCPQNTQNRDFIFINYRALCELGKISTPAAAIDFIEQAQLLSEILDNDSYRISLCRTKSAIFPKIADEAVKKKWWTEIIETLSVPNENVELDLYVDIAANLSQLPREIFLKYANNSQIEEIVTKLLSNYSIDPLSFRSFLHYYRCCELLAGVTESKTILAGFYNKVFEVMPSFPCQSKRHTNVLLAMAQKYMLIPADVVSDALKLEVLTKIKENECTRTIYYSLLYFVFSNNLVEDLSQLNADTCYFEEQHEKLTDGYNRYCNGDHRYAEAIFSEVMSCEIPLIANVAITNLAYMVRREETEAEYSFEDLIHKITDPGAFDFMNVFLYYEGKGKTDSDMYLKAREEIAMLSEEDREELYKWWSNVALVGEEESSFVLSLIS